MKSALFSLFGENWGQCDDFDNFDARKCDFRQNVLRMTGKERFVQFSWKAHCFKVLARTLGQCDDFENFDMLKNAIWPKRAIWPERSIFYNFHGKCTVFPFWGRFQASLTILKILTLKNAIWPKRAEHDLKKSVLYNFPGKRTVFPF